MHGYGLQFSRKIILTLMRPDETPEELMLNIPVEGILYKVSYKTAEMDQARYLTELVRDRIVTVPISAICWYQFLM
jgi:hypothetical protein